VHGKPMSEAVDTRAEMRLLELRITEALERPARVEVPEGFAARVAQRLPKRTARVMPEIRASQFGFAAMMVSLVVLLAAMVLLAPRATSHAIYWTALEWTFCAQFCALAVWVGIGRRGTE
jgi:hypothetical protein